MAFNALPISIELLHVISLESNELTDLFSKHTSQFNSLQEYIKYPNNLLSHQPFLDVSLFLAYIQTLMLLGISMHGGIFIPSLKTIRNNNSRLSLTWFSGLHDTFTFGKMDHSFIHFVSSFQQKCLNKRSHLTSITRSFFKSIHGLLTMYIDTLNQSLLFIDTFFQTDFRLLSSKSLPQEQLFVMISCLPIDQLNALFLYIQRFLPDDFTMKIESNSSIKVSQFFQTPSSDTAQLVEKVKVYFELYFFKNSPIITNLTQEKTSDFFFDMLKNNAVVQPIKTNLTQLRENQILMRFNIYTLYLDHINLLYDH